MSKLDREITAIFEEAFSTAQAMVPVVMGWMAEEDITSKEIEKRVSDYMEKHKPKTYDDYIRDLKRVFKEGGVGRTKMSKFDALQPDCLAQIILDHEHPNDSSHTYDKLVKLMEELANKVRTAEAQGHITVLTPSHITDVKKFVSDFIENK